MYYVFTGEAGGIIQAVWLQLMHVSSINEPVTQSGIPAAMDIDNETQVTKYKLINKYKPLAFIIISQIIGRPVNR